MGEAIMSRVAYIGNFGPEHSTENHVRQALESLGHEVHTFQENDLQWWVRASAGLRDGVDLVLWTRTKSLSDEIPDALKRDVLDKCATWGIPTVGFHLDRWWGLARQHEIVEDPFFTVSTLVTADGGHDKEWADAGVNHVWMPPAVSEFECVPGTFDEAYASDVAFVGSWGSYHPEWWAQRHAMLERLREIYGDRFRCWPVDGQPAVRGKELRDLYASVKVVVGDSCLSPSVDGSPMERYWSDRIPETLGRGAFLVHPWVKGIDEGAFLPGIDLFVYELGNLDMLHSTIEWALEHPVERAMTASSGRDKVLRQHTYTVRMKDLWTLLGI